jgi:hypothetical protein
MNKRYNLGIGTAVGFCLTVSLWMLFDESFTSVFIGLAIMALTATSVAIWFELLKNGGGK